MAWEYLFCFQGGGWVLQNWAESYLGLNFRTGFFLAKIFSRQGEARRGLARACCTTAPFLPPNSKGHYVNTTGNFLDMECREAPTMADLNNSSIFKLYYASRNVDSLTTPNRQNVKKTQKIQKNLPQKWTVCSPKGVPVHLYTQKTMYQ